MVPCQPPFLLPPLSSIPYVHVPENPGYATRRIDGTDVLHFPPSVHLCSTSASMTDFAGDGPPKLECDGSVVINFPSDRLFQARLTGPVVTFNFQRLEGRAFKGVPKTSRDQEGAEVKSEVFGVGKRADPDGLYAHDCGWYVLDDECWLRVWREEGSAEV